MPGVWELFVTADFSAAHRLTGYPGDCCRVHGHNWNVEARVRCRELNELGMGVDFRDIKESIRKVVSGLDHADLNALPAFRSVNPTAEHIAQYLHGELSALLNTEVVRVSLVKVWETEGTGTAYWEE